MFSKEFEIVLIIALAVITVMCFIGKGDIFLKTKGQQESKRTPEEQKKFGRVIGCFTAFLLVAECVLYFFGYMQWVTIAYLVAVAGVFLGLVVYCKNHS